MPWPERSRLSRSFIIGLRWRPATLKIGRPERWQPEPARSQLPMCGSATTSPRPPVRAISSRSEATAAGSSGIISSICARESLRMRIISTALNAVLRKDVQQIRETSTGRSDSPKTRRTRRAASRRRPEASA